MRISTDNGWFPTIGSRTPVLVISLRACDPQVRSHFPKKRESSEAKTAFPKQFKYMKIKMLYQVKVRPQNPSSNRQSGCHSQALVSIPQARKLQRSISKS